MRIIPALRAAGDTDPGLQRQVNEDQFHLDVARGLFMVVDGVGGQAAGGKAAGVALAMLRTRLERETGPTDERIRESITVANNEIHRLALTRSEWNGMACVLTVVVVEHGQAIIGHVGDTRLYKIRHDRIEKITRDHSPVGEREDSGELSESEAMRHPRRNEVYRDVGSEHHEPADPEFVDLQSVPFEGDSAFLLCSDGLSDLVDSASISHIIRQFAGDPQKVVRALIDAANDAGGKDNVTVVYVEGEYFPASHALPRTVPRSASHAATETLRRGFADRDRAGTRLPSEPVPRTRQLLRVLILVLVLGVIGIALTRPRVLWPLPQPPPLNSLLPISEGQVVQPTESITAALERAKPGSQIVVEPGEYREQLLLKDNVRVVSRVPRGATIRLPVAASEAEPAVVATGLSRADFVGFKIIGDAATPLGTGILVRNAALSIVDVEIAGATKVAIDFSDGPGAMLVGSEIHDNPGAAMTIRSQASPRIAHNAFVRNGMSERAATSLIIEPGAHPLFYRNVFRGISPGALGALDEKARLELTRENWFLGLHEPFPAAPAAHGARPGR